MPLWETRPLEEQSQITLINWTIYEVPATENSPATRHFVGYNCRDREGRVSSAITTFDAEKLTGTTNSGRMYVLSGPSGFNSDAWYVWNRWRLINGVEEFREISIEDFA